MTLPAWLAAREPAPPASLQERLGELIAPGTPAAPGEVAPALVQLAAEVVGKLLHDGKTDRGSALDLLVADALATYAFEAQADDPEALDARCRWAMQYLSKIADAS